MNTLFISTYASTITISLLNEGKNKETLIKESLKSHSIFLVPMIDEILKNNNLAATDLNEIIVVNGPGSFTGVRLGVTVAKTLAYTLNIPIKTISSIEAVGVSINNQNKIITISDNKGKYIGIFENNKLVRELVYVSEMDIPDYLSNYKYEIYETSDLNVESIYEYLKEATLVNAHAHAVKPIYIKGIEALNGK